MPDSNMIQQRGSIDFPIQSKAECTLQATSIYLVWISACFDPVGLLYGFRYFALLIAGITVAFLIIKRGFPQKSTVYWLYFILFFFLLPYWGAVLAVLRGGGGGEFIDTSNYAAAIYFAASLLYRGSIGINVGVRAMLFSLRGLAIVILVCYFCIYFEVFEGLVSMFPEYGVSYFGARQYAGVETPYIYFVASPMLVFYIVYSSYKILDEKIGFVSFVDVVLGSVALFLSGTRMAMILSIFIFPIVFACRCFGVLRTVLGFLFVIAILLGHGLSGGPLSAAFDLEEDSNSVKIGYLDLYRIAFEDGISVLFGQGFNAHLWFYPLRDVLADGASKIELTYLEIYRVFGIFFGSSVLALLLLIAFVKKIRNSRYDWVRSAVLFYLVGASLNPYLFSANGMLVLGLALSILTASFYDTAQRPCTGR